MNTGPDEMTLQRQRVAGMQEAADAVQRILEGEKRVLNFMQQLQQNADRNHLIDNDPGDRS
jgi:hypothetical protein